MYKLMTSDEHSQKVIDEYCALCKGEMYKPCSNCKYIDKDK